MHTQTSYLRLNTIKMRPTLEIRACISDARGFPFQSYIRSGQLRSLAAADCTSNAGVWMPSGGACPLHKSEKNNNKLHPQLIWTISAKFYTLTRKQETLTLCTSTSFTNILPSCYHSYLTVHIGFRVGH